MLQQKSLQGVVLFAEIMKKVYDGQYDDDLNVLAGSPRPEEVLSSGQGLSQLGQDLKDLNRALSAMENVLGVSAASSAPKPSLRELVRRVSEGGDPEAAAGETGHREEGSESEEELGCAVLGEGSEATHGLPRALQQTPIKCERLLREGWQ